MMFKFKASNYLILLLFSFALILCNLLSVLSISLEDRRTLSDMAPAADECNAGLFEVPQVQTHPSQPQLRGHKIAIANNNNLSSNRKDPTVKDFLVKHTGDSANSNVETCKFV